MRKITLEPQNKVEFNILMEFLKKNKIKFNDNDKKKKTSLRPPERPNINPILELAGIWKDEKITLKSLRKKAWVKRLKF